ncbi:AGAP013136-PA-like protein [Anopheles sinensis]|uniref:AGAP013136-PA-like protein n=1 Tax=Anopheles sinensis TaxID=74873 RepID=A0A084WF83_ANOSI|nr:AGAP013136-PA-like protein [Anopheles sinensis]
MDKLPIRDPTINLVPTSELRKFIGSLKLTPSTPDNIRKIHTTFNTSKGKKESKPANRKEDASNDPPPAVVDFTEKELAFIKQHVTESTSARDGLEKANDALQYSMDGDEPRSDGATGNVLKVGDIKWLYATLKQMRQSDPATPYLHTLLTGCRMELPTNPIQERNPVLEARCQRLRKEQEDREYHRMTKNVDSVRKHMPEETIAYQMKQINRHLIAVAQFLFSVAAGFAFGFIGIELIIGQLDFGFRLLLGIIIALIIALAEIYFLAKKLNEEYELPPPPAMYSKEAPSGVGKPIPASGMPKGPKGKEHSE